MYVRVCVCVRVWTESLFGLAFDMLTATLCYQRFKQNVIAINTLPFDGVMQAYTPQYHIFIYDIR